jgi:hypothetical protein
VTVALIAKMIGGYAYFLTANFVYTSNDAQLYHAKGVPIAEAFLSGQLSPWSLLPRTFGTAFIFELNGLVALLTGRSMLASYMVFSWFGFFGLWAFVGAFRQVFPRANIHRYAVLTFFLPSSLFWPSALGKEAWMLFGIGLFALGAAQVFSSQARGLALVALGTVATAAVRPHFTAILLAALLIAVSFRRGGSSALSPMMTMASIVFVLGGAAFAYRQFADILPNGDQGLRAILEATRRQTSTGGSEIDVTIPTSPLELARAFHTVLLRPMLFEARSVTQLFSALETTSVLGMFLVFRRDVVVAVKQVFANAYMRFVGVYTAGFIFAWSSVANLGILARQRSLMLPFLLVFFCVRPSRGTSAADSGGDIGLPQRTTPGKM